jgi:hypothetical protein
VQFAIVAYSCTTTVPFIVAVGFVPQAQEALLHHIFGIGRVQEMGRQCIDGRRIAIIEQGEGSDILRFDPLY